MIKSFVTSKEIPGRGPAIIIHQSVIDIPLHVRKKLDSLSVWGGNTSNDSSKYGYWEFPYKESDDERRMEKALSFLFDNGWHIEEKAA